MKIDRTIHMIIVPDEEKGGFNGTGQLVKTPEFKKLNLGYVLDEGKPSGNKHYVYIKIAERKPIQIRLTCKSSSAHSSKLMAHNSAHELIQVLNIFVNFQEEQKNKINNNHRLLLSAQITSLTANSAASTYNVIPAESSATIDIRVPPQISLIDAHKFVENIIIKFPKISCEILAQAKEEKNIDFESSRLYQTLKATIESLNLRTKPLVFEASTDLRFYLEQDIEGIGITPFLCSDNLHGVNESIDLSDLILGKEIFYKFLQEFCINKGAPPEKGLQ